MAEYRDVSFEDEVVDLDDSIFTGCTFSRCDVRYSGGTFQLAAVSFADCQFLFRGPAANTLGMLQWMRQEPGGRELFDLTFPPLDDPPAS
jgi:hypothetical protein